MQNSHYKVELSNGKQFTAIWHEHKLGNFKDVEHIVFDVPMASITYSDLKNIFSGEITSVKITEYKKSSPANYISADIAITEETVIYDGYGSDVTIETSVEGNYKVRIFKITEALKMQKELSAKIAEASAAICEMYENLS